MSLYLSTYGPTSYGIGGLFGTYFNPEIVVSTDFKSVSPALYLSVTDSKACFKAGFYAGISTASPQTVTYGPYAQYLAPVSDKVKIGPSLSLDGSTTRMAGHSKTSWGQTALLKGEFTITPAAVLELGAGVIHSGNTFNPALSLGFCYTFA